MCKINRSKLASYTPSSPLIIPVREFYHFSQNVILDVQQALQQAGFCCQYASGAPAYWLYPQESILSKLENVSVLSLTFVNENKTTQAPATNEDQEAAVATSDKHRTTMLQMQVTWCDLEWGKETIHSLVAYLRSLMSRNDRRRTVVTAGTITECYKGNLTTLVFGHDLKKPKVLTHKHPSSAQRRSHSHPAKSG